ncbi:BTAD domain-containing putative transcriptional regulator [Amycolatopsis benzoatilytica]|uniref:BTAD domain-containing putative transcriptional regulator n=1 Tax=Amycolatopsis benzoatilytica TaxID=346045 RepID=UPI000382B197|nr:BTAD domain-containing putative transcriptional regulator [Amycolatopsis benzoatilytica]
MEFRILGPVAVIGDDGSGVPLGPPRQRALLATLLMHLGEPLPVSRLIELLWGDAKPTSAVTIVHGSISGLRRALAAADPGAADLLATEPGGYVLRARPDQVDALRFEQLLSRGRNALPADPESASAALAEALALWRGPALSDVDTPVATETAARLNELRCDAFETKAEADLALGRHAHLVDELEAWTAQHPLRERLRAHLMVALYRSGRQADALAAYQAARRALLDELGVEPGPVLRDLHRAVLQQHPSLDPPDATRPRARLPRPLGAFVGRDQERAEVTALLDAHRLVTLIGAAGVGKTRLAIEVGRAAAARFPAGVWFVDLAPLTASALVTHTVAGALGLRAEPGSTLLDTVSAALGHRRGLLILDNCELVIEGCRTLVEALAAAGAEARVLATSRESLGIAGEVGCPVRPLPVPGQDASWERVAASEAGWLFAARAATTRPGFRVTEGNAEVVGDICRRLDGLPLALELAAAQVATLPLRRIRDQLDHRSRLLDSREGTTGGRHHGLDTAFDGSYRSLSEPERIVFARLSVFAGGFTLDAAEAVVADAELPSSEVARLLSGLVARSLVQLEEVAPARGRYRILEPLRRYAYSRLVERGEDMAAARLHARYFRYVVEETEPNLYRAGSARWLDRLRADSGNLRAALEWAFGEHGDRELGARLASGLWHRWDLAGTRVEGLHWLDAGLAATSQSRTALRMRLLAAATLLRLGLGELATAQRLADEQLALARSVGDRRWEGDALTRIGMVSWARGDPAAAHRPLEQAVRALRASGDRWREAIALAHRARALRDDDQLAAAQATAESALEVAQEVGEDAILGVCLDVGSTIANLQGRVGRATELIALALQHYRAVGYREGEASALHVTGLLALADQPERARDSFRTALELCIASGHRAGIAANLEGLGRALLASGARSRAAAFLGAAAAQRARISVPASATARPALDAALGRLRSELGAEEFERASSRGGQASPDELVEWAAETGTGAPLASVTFVYADAETERLAPLLDREALASLSGWLDRTLRSCCTDYGAERIRRKGRGYLATFRDAATGLRCACEIQQRMAEHRRAHGFAPRIRVGVDCRSGPGKDTAMGAGTGDLVGAAESDDEATAVAVGAARAAGYGRVSATRSAVEAAKGAFPASAFGPLGPAAGIPELGEAAGPVEVAIVEWSAR